MPFSYILSLSCVPYFYLSFSLILTENIWLHEAVTLFSQHITSAEQYQFLQPLELTVYSEWVCRVYHPTQHIIGHFRDDYTGQMTKPTVSKHWRKPVGRQRSGLNPTRATPPCYNNTTLGNCIYTQRKGPNVTNPICLTCKKCSYKCAANCEHCVTQSKTELF